VESGKGDVGCSGFSPTPDRCYVERLGQSISTRDKGTIRRHPARANTVGPCPKQKTSWKRGRRREGLREETRPDLWNRSRAPCRCGLLMTGAERNGDHVDQARRGGSRSVRGSMVLAYGSDRIGNSLDGSTGDLDHSCGDKQHINKGLTASG
jgi:hypothetical protein